MDRALLVANEDVLDLVLLERTPLDFREEGRNFLCRGQFGISLEN